MSIKFEGIEFSTVAELVEYKKLIKEKDETCIYCHKTMSASEFEIHVCASKVVEEKLGKDENPTVIFTPVPKVENSVSSPFSEMQLIRETFDNPSNHTKSGKFKKGVIRKLAKRFSMNVLTLKKRLSLMKKAGVLSGFNQRLSEQMKHNWKYARRAKKSNEWSQVEKEILIDYLNTQAKYSPTGKILKGNNAEIAKRLGKPKRTISNMKCYLKQSGLLKPNNSVTHQVMLKRKAVVPEGFVEERLRLANGAVAKDVDDLDFPQIFPLHDDAQKIFEQMVINALANKSRISYFDCRSLQLREGHEWDGRKWREFCLQVMLSRKQIAHALNFKAERMTVEVIEGYHYLVFK